jgi:hypothetical protein
MPCITHFSIKELRILATDSIYVFGIALRINNEYFPKQMVGLRNGDCARD